MCTPLESPFGEKRVKIYIHPENRRSILNLKCQSNQNQTLLEGIMFRINETFELLDCEFLFPTSCAPSQLGISISSNWLALNEIGLPDKESKDVLRQYYYLKIYNGLRETLSGSIFKRCQVCLGNYDCQTFEIN